MWRIKSAILMSGWFWTCCSRNKPLFWENDYLALAEKNTEQVGDKYLPQQIIRNLWANYTQRWALIKVSRPPSTHHPLWIWFSWSPRWLWAVWFCLAHQCCRGPLLELPNKLKCVHCVEMTDEPSILWLRVLSHSWSESDWGKMPHLIPRVHCFSLWTELHNSESHHELKTETYFS